MLRNLLVAALLIFVFASGGSMYLFFMQEDLIFHPEQLPDDYAFEFNLPFEEIHYEPEEDAVIHALHFRAENPRGIVLYFHGNAGSLRNWGYISEDIVPQGYDLLIMDYRTFGKSKGSLSEEALHKDARYIYDRLREDWDPGRIVLYGRSLGSGIALKLASDVPVSAVILESPYYNMKELASTHFPLLPVGWLLNYTFRSDKWIKQTDAFVSMVHGTHDDVIPHTQSKRLADLIPPERLSYKLIEGGGHNNLNQFKDYHRFLENALTASQKD